VSHKVSSPDYLSSYYGVHPGGDFLKGDGTGSFSIYGDKFPVRH